MAILAVAGVGACRGASELGLPRAPAADRRIQYGTLDPQFGDLRVPPGAGPHPVAIVLHGGCWLSRHDLDYMAPLSAALTEAGIATWTVEYRRIGDAGGGWPGTFTDVGGAADYVRTLAQQFSLDLERVIAVGHSSGGHLALWLAARRRLPERSVVHTADPLVLRGVVALAGITDLAQAGGCTRNVVDLLGEGDDLAAREAQTSPLRLLPFGVPTILVQGSRDGIVPIAGGEAFVAAARARGDASQLVVVEGVGHFDVVNPASGAWTQVRDAVLAMVGLTGGDRRATPEAVKVFSTGT